MTIKSFSKIKKLAGQRVFLRVDFNVPNEHGKIGDDYKLRAGLETIKYLQAKSARIIIATHWGDPNGKKIASHSTKVLAVRLARLLKTKVAFCPEAIGPKALKMVAGLKNGEILFLENLRFYSQELTDGRDFAASLAALADIYINDAFAVSHRQQASVSALKKLLPAYAGALLEHELKNLHKILKPRKPLVAVLGGAKIKSKVNLIKNFHQRANFVLLGGGLANNFLRFMGVEIGKSLADENSEAEVRKFFKGKKLSQKIILPLDFVVRDAKKSVLVKKTADLSSKDIIFDIGPETVSLFASYIKKAKTIIWNGPLGKFEEKVFSHGTVSIARVIASHSRGRAYGVVGGGETVAALEMTKMQAYVDWVSTAGGAMLSYLGGEKMPGLEGIVKK